MLKLKFGLTMFLTMVVPTGFLSGYFFGGMYGTLFKQVSPSAYLSMNLMLSLAISFSIALIFIKKANLYARTPKSGPGLNLLIAGGIVLLLPNFLQISTSMVQGGGSTFALLSYAAPIVFIAKLVMYLGIAKLFLSIKPHESYVYP